MCSYAFNNFTTVISEPDDVTMCEGRTTSFTCVFNGSITSGDVQWYRLLKDSGTTERLGRLGDFTAVPIGGQNSFTTILYIFNTRKSYTGYYWVRSPLGDVCNTSFIVVTSMCRIVIYTYIRMYIFNYVYTVCHNLLVSSCNCHNFQLDKLCGY